MIFSSLLLVACAHRGGSAGAMDPDSSPILASPDGDVYAAHGGTARDPVVARAADGLPWDEALSGAAGTLALAADRQPELGQARWAAWRAGYPYPLMSISFAAVAPAELPADLIAAVKANLKPGDQVGLARARVGSEDRWVALIGRASRSVAPFARQLDRGVPLNLSGAGIARYSLTSPTGVVKEGAMPAAPILEETGEWWLELYAEDGRVTVSAPVTVGMPASGAPPLDLPGHSASGPIEARQDALAAVNEIRAVFDLHGLGTDATLDLLSRQPLEQAGVWDASGARDRVHAAGFSDGAGVSCSAPTVPLCLDAVLRTGAGRQALLNPAWRLAGGGARVEASGVTLVLFLGPE